MMEGQKFTSDSLKSSSPKLLQCFQADRFLKSTNNLNIPDTIPELSSTELSGNYFKMEQLKTPTNDEGKENLVSNLSFKSDESSASTIIAVDNSFLVKCEKKLLENSISDSEKYLSANKSIKNENFSELSKKLGLSNETISTPTHILRKQISILKNEIAESDEFHDLEMKILKEEKRELNGEDLPYEQVIEKYSALLDLYTSLKNEYDDYRREQEKLQYKTADCLESLCSQIEASDSSLNFSSASFASFNTDIKSSTMMNNISEVEATVVNDATLYDVDPLAATQEKLFKTPVHLPFKSSKKLFLQESNINKTIRTPGCKAENSLDDYTIQMLTLKTADKVKEVEDLEQRLLKVEDLVSSLQSENEQLRKEYFTENKKLKDDLVEKTEQFEELTKKLFTETISLNPALKETLTNASGTKLLTVFIETIIENCKSIQDDLVRKFFNEKEDWESQKKSQAAKILELENQIKILNGQESKTSQFENLKKQYDELKNQMQQAENTISIRNEEIRLLQSHDTGIRKTREDLDLANEAVTKLERQLSVIQNEKEEIQKRYQELEEVTKALEEEINSQKSTILSHEQENENLKISLQQSQEIVEKLKSKLIEKEDTSEVEELRNKEISLKNEILKIFKESKEVFTDFLPDFYNESTETLLKTLNEFFDVKYGSSDIVSAFSETIFTCCEKVKENLNKTFESNKAELLIQIEDLRNDINMLKSENEDKISEIIAEKENYKKLSESLEDKLAELETEESQVKILREELTKTEEVLIKLKSQIISIEGEKVEMENRCSDLEKTNTDLQTLISTKETIIKDLENSMEIIQKDLDAAKEMNEKLEESKMENLAKLNDLALEKEAVAKLESQISAIQNEKEDVQKQYQELEKVTQILRDEINSQKSLILAHEQENENLKTSLQQLQEVAEKLKSDLEMNEKQDSSEKEELRNEITTKETIIKDLENSVEIIRKELEGAKENNKVLEESKMESLVKLNDLALTKETVKELETQLSAIQNEKEELQKRCQELDGVIQALREEINSQKCLLLTREEENENLKTLLQQSQDIVEKLKSDLKIIEKEGLSENEELRNEISLKETIIKDLENSIEIIQKELEGVKENNKVLEESKMESLSKLNDLELEKEVIAKLESQLSTIQNEKEEIQKRYQELEGFVQATREEMNSHKFLILTHEQEIENLKTSLQQSQEVAERLKSDLEMNEKQNSSEKEELRNEVLRMFKDCNELLTDFLTELCKERTETTTNPLKDIFKVKYSNSDIVSAFSESISICCEKVKGYLNTTFETNKAEFLIQIEDLKNDINEIKAANEVKINEIIEEKENYMKLKESLENKLAHVESKATQVKVLREELSETKEDLMQLKSQIACFEDEKVEMENRCSDLEKSNAELKNLITAKEILIKDLECSVEIIRKELEAAKESNKMLEESKMENLVKLNDFALTNETVRELETQLSVVRNEKEELQKQYQELEEVIKALKEEINSQKSIIISHEQENENLRTSLQQSGEVIEKLKSDLETVEKQDSNEKEELRNEMLKIFKESNEVLMDFLPEFCKENNETILRTLNDVFEVKYGCSEIVSAFSETIFTCCEKLKENLYKTFETNKEKFLIQIEDLKNDINKIKSENELKISEIIAEKENYKRLNQSLENKLSELESKESQVNILRKELSETIEDLAKLKSQIISFGDEKVEVENRCSDLEKTNMELQILINTKETIVKDLENSIEIIRKELEGVKESNKVLEESKMESLVKLNEFALANEAVKELETQLSAIQNEKEELQKRYQELEGVTQALREETNTQKFLVLAQEQENESLKISLQQSEEVIEKLKLELEMTEKQHSIKVESLRNEEVSLRNEILRMFRECNEVLIDILPEFCKERTETISNALNDIFKDKYSNSDIILTFSETIASCCEKAKENLNKTFETNKAEFLLQVEDLKNDINEIKAANEVKISEIIEEKENYKRSNQSLEDKMAEIKEELIKLKSHLENVEVEKVEIEKMCSDLEITNTELQNLIITKETIIKNLESSVEVIQKDLESAKELSEKLEESKMESLSKLNEELKEVRSKMEELSDENNLLRQKSNGFNNLLNVLEDLFDVEKFVKMSAEELSEMFDEKIKSNSEFALFYEVLETLERAFKQQHVKTKEVVDELKDYKNSYNEALKYLEDGQKIIMSNSGDVNVSEVLMKISPDNKIVSVFNTTIKDACESVKNQMVRMFENEKRDLVEQQKMIMRELDLELKSLKDENNEVIEILEECKKRMENEVDEPFSEKLCDLVADLPNEKHIISLITSIIIIVTKNIEDELYKKFNAKRNELEKQRNVDLTLINDLQNQIKDFEEKNSETNCLQDRILEVENSLSTLSEEFKAQKQALEKTEENLAAAEGTIVKLKSQLRTIKTEKLEIITRCQQLEEDAVTLQADIDTKDTILKGFEEIQSTKQKIENENSELKERLLQSEEIIGNLRVTLQNTREEQNNKELEWKKEIDLLKSEKEDLAGLTDKIESLEENKKQLINVLSDIQSFLEMPKDVLPKLLSGELENEKIFTERISNFTKCELDSLKIENKNLKCGNENLKEKVKELNKMISESDKKDNFMLDNSVQTGLRSKSGRKSDLCARKLDKLEEINHNLTELLTRILTETDFPTVEKLKFCSVRDYPNVKKQVMAHVESLVSKIKELTADNCKLDEECDSYAQTIKDLQKEAVKAWKTNKTKLEALETELANAKEEKKAVEKEKEELMSKISKLENECQKLKSNSKVEGSTHGCNCGTDSKKINELKRTLLIKEQKILELQDVESQNAMYKSQIKYLETAVQQEKKKINEEKEKNKRLENELKEMKKNQKASEKASEDNQMLEQLRMGGSLAGGVVQDCVDKEKMRKLAKDIGILKELCRARYAEIKQLEMENAALRTLAPKNPNQLDSPVRTRSYNTRSKNLVKEMWKPEAEGKENSVLL